MGQDAGRIGKEHGKRGRVHAVYSNVSLSLIIPCSTDNDPIVSRYVSVPREMAQFNAASFVAGIIESVLDGTRYQLSV